MARNFGTRWLATIFGLVFLGHQIGGFAGAWLGGVVLDRTGSYDSGPATRRGGPLLIEGELVAKSTGTDSAFGPGQRIFHVKFGNGTVAAVDGNKLTIDFDKAGRKMVLDSFVKGIS